MGGDPAPNIVKRLRVIYSLDGSAPTKAEAMEGADIRLGAGAGGLYVVQAFYGVPGRDKDVTGKRTALWEVPSLWMTAEVPPSLQTVIMLTAVVPVVRAALVRGMVAPGSVSASIAVNNSTMGGDPAPNIVKRLRVTYSLNEAALERVEVPEGSSLHLGLT
jgi:hypothetical protein